MGLLERLADLVGVDSVADLGNWLARKLEVQAATEPPSTESLLVNLVRREAPLGQTESEISITSALTAIAAIDPRVAAMLALVRQLGLAPSIALSHEELVGRIYEDKRFVGMEPKSELAVLVLRIAKHCDASIGQDDLELFMDARRPSQFFYETVQAYAESLPEALGEDLDEESEEEDDEDAAMDQPVRAYIKPFSVRSLIEMVEEGELDVDPAWQRTDVWSLKKKRELIRSLILGIPLPSIILHSRAGRMSIIDGKQRLLSIVKFVANEYKLPKYDVPPASPLYTCRGAFYDKERKPSLPKDVRKDFRLREIPALLFEDVPESRLRNIFHLYNVAGMKLNAAEIRNAVYQANPIHRVLYVLAGEGRGQTDLGIGGLSVQESFKTSLRRTYPGAHRRYQGVDFLARYLGYSRAALADETKDFKVPSTSKAIDNFFDHRSAEENASTVATEIIRVFEAASTFFDISDERLAFFTRGPDGKRKFSKLAATTHMVATRYLLHLIAKGLIDESQALNASGAVDIEVPEKQQSATIWDYQARVLLALRDVLGHAVAESAGEGWPQFFMKMEFCKLPPIEELS